MLLTPQMTNEIWVKLNESGIKNFDELIEKFNDEEFKCSPPAQQIIELFNNTLAIFTENQYSTQAEK